jgi:hypothetical protein
MTVEYRHNSVSTAKFIQSQRQIINQRTDLVHPFEMELPKTNSDTGMWRSFLCSNICVTSLPHVPNTVCHGVHYLPDVLLSNFNSSVFIYCRSKATFLSSYSSSDELLWQACALELHNVGYHTTLLLATGIYEYCTPLISVNVHHIEKTFPS